MALLQRHMGVGCKGVALVYRFFQEQTVPEVVDTLYVLTPPAALHDRKEDRPEEDVLGGFGVKGIYEKLYVRTAGDVVGGHGAKIGSGE